jgi:hypothetical protein
MVYEANKYWKSQKIDSPQKIVKEIKQEINLNM